MDNADEGVLPVPTYLLGSDELGDLVDRLTDIIADSDRPCTRADACVAAIRRELGMRPRPAPQAWRRCARPIGASRILTRGPAMTHAGPGGIVHVRLVGTWTRAAVWSAAQEVEAFFAAHGDGVSDEIALLEDGTATAHACAPVQTLPPGLAATLDAGPGWVLSSAPSAADDGRVFVSGEGLDGIMELRGTLDDPLMQRSEWEDADVRKCLARAARIAGAGFSLRH